MTAAGAERDALAAALFEAAQERDAALAALAAREDAKTAGTAPGGEAVVERLAAICAAVGAELLAVTRQRDALAAELFRIVATGRR